MTSGFVASTVRERTRGTEMHAEFNGALPMKLTSWPSGLVVALACCLFSSPTIADSTIVSQREVLMALESAVSYHLQKNKLRMVVDAACYFDPEVTNSMACTWRSGSGGADSFRVRQLVKAAAIKRCKQRGGRDCERFLRNGVLGFRRLYPLQAGRIEEALLTITTFDEEASPFPEGESVAVGYLSQFERLRDRFESFRKRRPGHNPQYALCTNDQGPWASFGMEGSALDPSLVRAGCVMNCRAVTKFLSRPGECYVVYANGEFASDAAKRAFTQ